LERLRQDAIAVHPLRWDGPVEQVVLGATAGLDSVRVLDAGCGWKSVIRLPEHWHLVGIDRSAEELARNQRVNEKIVGDVETYEWPAESFDLILCWDILEHLDSPLGTLDRLVGALKRGGILVLGFPNLYSFKGLLTKFTPFAFHEWVYRALLGSTRPMSRQYPTIFKAELTPKRITRFAVDRGLGIVYWLLYEGHVQKELRWRYRAASLALGALGGVARAVSLGRVDLNLTDCIAIMRKNVA
jgi:SAM-dependent methyltransferase